MTGWTFKHVTGAALVALAGLASGTAAQAADKVVVQMKWVPQAQFAGYYVAAAKGFYKDAGLEVTILPGGPDINPQQVLAGGEWRPTAIPQDPHAIGFHISALYSPVGWFSWSQAVRDWEAAQGKPEDLKTFRNTVLGEHNVG